MVGETILVCESEGVVALDLQKSLKDMGYSVPVVAGSGEEAVRTARYIRPALVITEVTLERAMDGIEAAARIKSCLDILIIYFTADTDSQTLEHAKSTYPNGCLLKPFSLNQLRVNIEIALHRHRSGTVRGERDSPIYGSQTMLPICAYCKRIRDTSGMWTDLENYFGTYFRLIFTHSLCPSCVKIFHP